MRVWAAGLVVALAASCGSKPAPKPVIKPKPVVDEIPAAAKGTAEAVANVYRVLTLESAVPGDPEILRDAAIDALAPKGWAGPPIAWTNDAEKDADVLRDAVLTLAKRKQLADRAAMRAATAMAAAVKDTHTFAIATPVVQALLALVAGQPATQPGIQVHKLDDGRWAVSDVLPGSAAANSRVQRGDILVTIGDQPIVRGYLDLAPYIGVVEGSETRLIVERAGKNEEHALRFVAVAAPIAEWKVLPKGVGYLRLWSCPRSDDAARDAGKVVAGALADLDKKKAKKLVLDLRGNPGGFPFDVASLFVTSDPLLVGVSSDGAETPVARTIAAAWDKPRPLVVIVDEGTSSGAEMIALALRDLAFAKIVGRPTAGGLTFPTLEKQKKAPDVSLSYPLSRTASPTTKAALDGNQLVPDIAAPNPTAADYAARKDPQLDAALAALATMR